MGKLANFTCQHYGKDREKSSHSNVRADTPWFLLIFSGLISPYNSRGRPTPSILGRPLAVPFRMQGKSLVSGGIRTRVGSFGKRER